MSYKESVSPTGTAKIRRKTTLTLNPLTIDAVEGDTTIFTGKLSEASGPNIGKGIPDKKIHLMVDGSEACTPTITKTDGSLEIIYTWLMIGDTIPFHVAYLGD